MQIFKPFTTIAVIIGRDALLVILFSGESWQFYLKGGDAILKWILVLIPKKRKPPEIGKNEFAWNYSAAIKINRRFWRGMVNRKPQ